MMPGATRDIRSKTTHRPVVSTPPAKDTKRDHRAAHPGAASPAAKRLKIEPSALLEDPARPSQLWVDKYKPVNLKHVIGQQGEKSNLRKLQTWLQHWPRYHLGGAKPPARPPPWNATSDTGAWAKMALLSGPPGVGKTTTAYLVSRELGFDVMEMNASDARSKKLLEQNVAVAMSNTSLASGSKKRVLLMDEVDGMAGNEDRGGIAELIQLVKKSQIPVICMCNDRNHQKIRSLANYCFDLRFQRPRVEQIKGAMMSIIFKEKINITPDALTEVIAGCNQDVRQVLHHLSLIKARESSIKMTGTEAKTEADRSKKTSIKVGPFDVVRRVFSAKEQEGMSLMDKSDLFFQDYSLGPLFTQENYLLHVPKAAKGDPKATMDLVSKAADSFCDGDLTSGAIRSRNAWNLLPIQAMFSSVIPGEYMSGYMSGQPQFPTWFGKYSKQNKFDRILQELQMHTRLSAGVTKQAMNMEFSQFLRGAIVNPMLLKGSEGIPESVEVMKKYSLLREDLDNILEIGQWPGQDNPMKYVDSKTKAAFTRAYNKEIVLPYSNAIGSLKKGKSAATSVEINPEALEEDDERESDDEDDDDISKDAMIKAKPKKPTKGKSESGATSSSARGGKATTSRGKGTARGRGKK
ncbi:replication factor C subunit 1-like [Tigriopus californicus]|uniref:replication factor C subunit 1-like n=1 Tax=Tigriopus californicus TaxID=6832 RepID=UPI0027DA2EFE|nr:replication factor C subunit 1-like [Tigriopus californicus]